MANKLYPTKIFILIVLGIISFSTYAPCQDNATSAISILDDLQRGFWLNKTYLGRLYSTKSPRKAGKGIIQSGFEIKKENNEYRVLVIRKFHEGGTEFAIIDLKKTTAKNVYELITAPPENYSHIKSNRVVLRKKADGDEIQWSFTTRDNNKADLVFKRIEPNMDQFVNRILLAGKYKDTNNRLFEFTDDGRATWPDRSFKYEIDLNMEYDNDPENWPECDDFFYMEMQGRKVLSMTSWGFSVQKDKLVIYEPNVSCSKKILYSLIRIK